MSNGIYRVSKNCLAHTILLQYFCRVEIAFQLQQPWIIVEHDIMALTRHTTNKHFDSVHTTAVPMYFIPYKHTIERYSCVIMYNPQKIHNYENIPRNNSVTIFFGYFGVIVGLYFEQKRPMTSKVYDSVTPTKKKNYELFRCKMTTWCLLVYLLYTLYLFACAGAQPPIKS